MQTRGFIIGYQEPPKFTLEKRGSVHSLRNVYTYTSSVGVQYEIEREVAGYDDGPKCIEWVIRRKSRGMDNFARISTKRTLKDAKAKVLHCLFDLDTRDGY